ncbi:Inter-alpha-trypsin inhibitor heavy chain H3, partial [Ophiophagus hannah]
DVELPKTAFITNFTLTVDGVTYPGIIREKEAAQKQYEQAVSRGQTAGLVKAAGRKTETFSVSVNIASSSKVTFQLTYEELLKRKFGKYEIFIKVNPKQLVNKFEIEANIFEPQGISELEVEGTFLNNELLPVVKKSFSGKKGHISFSPTIEQQQTCDNCTTTLLQGDFVIKYDVNRDSPNNLQVVNGYFVHFFAPKILERLPKNVAFVIDVSGSMSGQKIRQAKEALTKIVEDLKEEDHFNIILFESSVSTWKDNLIQATPENVNQSKEFIQQINAWGGTNYNDGLLTGIEMLNKAHESKSVPERSASLVIMLSDGEANALNEVTYTEQADVEETTKALEEQQYIFGEYIEKLWAYLTIQQLLEARSVAQGDEKENITAKALELSLKYKFVTPLTSMVVTKPEDNEEKEAVADKLIEGTDIVIRTLTHLTLSAKQQVSSYQPPPAPYYYSSVDGDPHFIIAVPQKEDALCFNINEEPGVVLNLIRDPVTGMTVNGQLIGDKKSINNVRPQNTYFGKLGIVTMNRNVRLEITTQNIILQNGVKRRVFSWLDEVALQQP